jgi:hypothetical protein
MAFDRAAAKAAGYSDEEIDAYLQSQPATVQAPAPVQQAEAEPGEPPAPTTVIPEVGSTSGNITEAATLGGMAVAPYVLPAAGAAAAAYGGNKLYQGWQKGVNAAHEYNAVNASNAATHAATQELKTLQQIAKGTGPEAEAAKQRILDIIKSRGGQVAQTTGQVAQNVRPAVPTGAPATGPVAPPMGAAANEASMTNSVRQAAASRISNLMPKATEALGSVGRAVSPALGAAGRFLSAANPYLTAAQGLTYSKDLGPQVPTSGPLRGSEINPRTGRGWTAQELAAYKQQYGG